MKLLIVISLIASTVAFAGETKTLCPFTAESVSRLNPKAALADKIIKEQASVASSSSSKVTTPQ